MCDIPLMLWGSTVYDILIYILRWFWMTTQVATCAIFFFNTEICLFWSDEQKKRIDVLVLFKRILGKNQLKMLTSNRQNKQNDRIYEEAEAAVSGNWRVIYIQVISLRCCQNHLLFLRQLYYFNMFWYEGKKKNNAFLNFQSTYQNKL